MDVVEVAYSTTVYHAVYTGAAIGCLLVGDYATLAGIREWMSDYFKEEENCKENECETKEESIFASDIDEASVSKIDQEDKIPSFKLLKENESGYLTSSDVED